MALQASGNDSKTFSRNCVCDIRTNHSTKFPYSVFALSQQVQMTSKKNLSSLIPIYDYVYLSIFIVAVGIFFAFCRGGRALMASDLCSKLDLKEEIFIKLLELGSRMIWNIYKIIRLLLLYINKKKQFSVFILFHKQTIKWQ